MTHQEIEARALTAAVDILYYMYDREEPNYTTDKIATLMSEAYKAGKAEQKQIDIDKACGWLWQHAISVIKFGVGDIIRLKGSLAEYTITSISDGAYHGNGWKIDFDCEDDYELVEAADPTEALSVINIEAFRKAMEK